MRYIDLIQKFRDFSTNHLQVNTYFNGETFDFQSQESIYPAIITVNMTSSIEIGSTNLSFDIFVVDKMKSDMSNKDEIFSETLDIAQDFIAYFDDDLDIGQDSISLQPVFDSLDDKICGWIISVTFLLENTRNECKIPLVNDND